MTPPDAKSRLDFAALLDQGGRMLRLESALPAPALVPERMVLKDAVNQPFELVLDVIGASAFFELKSLVGEQLSLRLLQADGRYKPIHGYVFEAAQLGSDGGFTRYRLVVRPWLAFLALRRDAAVFHDKTALEVADSVMRRYPSANFRFDVSEALRQRRVCTQYRETDLAFVQRLLAEEGLSWHFEHLDEAAADADAQGHARHVLVVCDRLAVRHALGIARFTSQHPTASTHGQRDAVTAFMVQRQVQPNAVTRGSWNDGQLTGIAGQDATALDIGELPVLEVYDGTGADRYTDSAHAARAAALALAALELDFERFEGQGSTRHFEPGRTFTLMDHPLFGPSSGALNHGAAVLHAAADNEFVLLAVEHHATNNLGVQAAELLGNTALERGSYKNHFHAARAATPLVPRSVARPTAHGLQTALVVGVPGEPLTTDRDLRVQIRFPWQRGDDGPEDATRGTWVRVAQAAAGANWGQVFVPRVGSEVAVAFVEGDIDRPVITGGLYNGQDLPPFSAGLEAGVNHPGVIDGWHSQALDGAGFNQWVLDNATGQMRMRLHASYSAAEVGLGHLIQQPATSAQRGARRGAGFEAGTQGWASLRAGKGLLLSTSARPGSYGSAQGTQMGAAEAVAQLKAALAMGTRLSEAAQASQAAPLASHAAGQALDAFTRAIDPQQDGRLVGSVNGQVAVQADGRAPGNPVEAFATPQVLLDTPSTLLMATEASIATYAALDLSLAVQGDIQHSAAHTFASVSGQTTSWYTHAGGAKLCAANGPVSLQAHTDSLQILADQGVTVVSVNDEITISAKEGITLMAGQSSIVLDGADIDFCCPGTWEVRSGTHAFLSGAGQPASLSPLPDTRAALYQEQFVARNAITGEPVAGMPYRIEVANGEVFSGVTGADGRTEVVATPDPQALKLYWVAAVDSEETADADLAEGC